MSYFHTDLVSGVAMGVSGVAIGIGCKYAYDNWGNWLGRTVTVTNSPQQSLVTPATIQNQPVTGSEKEAKLEIFQTPLEQWEELTKQSREACSNIVRLKNFILLFDVKSEEKLHEVLTSNNAVIEGIIFKRDNWKEWDDNIQKIWEERNEFIQGKVSKSDHPGQPSIIETLQKMNQFLATIDLVRQMVIQTIHREKPTSQEEVKKLYSKALQQFKVIQQTIAKVIGGVDKEASAITRLEPVIPKINIEKVPSPFSKKVTLQHYFESQSIAGVPTGLDDVVVTIAAAYDSTYQNSVSKLGLFPERGMVLHGPPGTGKTVMAKAIGEYLGCDKGHIKISSGSNLLDKFVGNTEKNIRELFIEAKNDPTNLYVIIIDEIEWILSRRELQKNSWGTSFITQFLTELDGIDSPKNILTIGITNYVDKLDPAITRPGRLGSLIEVPLPDAAQRKLIFDLYLSKIDRAFLSTESTKLADQLAEVSDGFSGADIKAAVQRTSNVSFMEMIRARHFNNSEVTDTPLRSIIPEEFIASINLIRSQQQVAGKTVEASERKPVEEKQKELSQVQTFA